MLKMQPELSVIMVTAYRIEGEELQVVQGKAKGIFNKLLNIERFLKILEKMLREVIK